MSTNAIDELLSSLGSSSGAGMSGLFASLASEGNMEAMCQFFLAIGGALNTDLDNKMDGRMGSWRVEKQLHSHIKINF